MIQKSYLKWAGSKNKALTHLLPIISKFEFSTFVEPFVGAANVSLNVDADQYLWNDLNTDLVVSHKQVIEDTDGYIEICKGLFEAGFDKYNCFRDVFNARYWNTTPTYHAALFQYLNKHGFNGLCRYNSKGGYNVPIGTVTKNPKTIPKDQIKHFATKFHESLAGLFNEDFEQYILRVDKVDNALIYCDPPYVPATASNFKYTSSGFGIEEQTRLVQAAKNSKHNVLISNHWNEITKELYKDADHLWTFPVQRTISRDGNNRVQVEECVVLYK